MPQPLLVGLAACFIALISNVHLAPSCSGHAGHHDSTVPAYDKFADEGVAAEFMRILNENLTILHRSAGEAQWAFETNITDYNEDFASNTSKLSDAFERSIHSEVVAFKYQNFTEPKLRRMFARKQILGVAALGAEKSSNFSDLITETQTIYSTAKICVSGTCGLPLEPNLTNILSTSRDWDTLSEVWVNWRNATGRQMRDLYVDFVELGHEVAEKNNLEDYGALIREPWEDEDLKGKLAALWNEVKPLYARLHNFVRQRLIGLYGDRMPSDGTIPAHILGNMWAQTWTNIAPLVEPFPGKAKFDVTEEMKRQNYTVRQIFNLSENFFESLGLEAMTPAFWNKSMLARPNDREVVCHASAWDFYGNDDYRIKECTDITHDSLVTVHHEMGHIAYYMLYRNQPYSFKEGANNGFHEAVGDTISLSVSSPRNLERIGLLLNYTEDPESIVNHQMFNALETVAFLPFGYIVDMWRWDVFAGTVNETEWNRKWWEYRIKYQGISPPVARSEEDMDPGAKSHVADDTPYIRYFVATLLRFSFHEALCKIAGQSDDLHKCNIYGNKEVGQKLREVLSQGSSVPWPEQLRQMTGSGELSAKPMLKYYKPLITYLDSVADSDASFGWDSAVVDDYFPSDELAK